MRCRSVSDCPQRASGTCPAELGPYFQNKRARAQPKYNPVLGLTHFLSTACVEPARIWSQPARGPQIRVQCARGGARVKFSFDSVWKYIFICMCLNSVEAKVFKEYSIVKQR